MIARLFFVVLCLMQVGCGGSTIEIDANGEWYDAHSASVMIEGRCGGVAVSETAIITAAHCISSMKDVSYQLWGDDVNTRRLANVESIDSRYQHDIAVLRTVDSLSSFVPVSDRLVIDGETCVVHRPYWGRQWKPTTLWGPVYNSIVNEHYVILFLSPGVAPGDSGSPLVCSSGLVGVVSFGAMSSDQMGWIGSYAVTTSELVNKL